MYVCRYVWLIEFKGFVCVLNIEFFVCVELLDMIYEKWKKSVYIDRWMKKKGMVQNENKGRTSHKITNHKSRLSLFYWLCFICN
jgi:hypothetical protein